MSIFPILIYKELQKKYILVYNVNNLQYIKDTTVSNKIKNVNLIISLFKSQNEERPLEFELGAGKVIPGWERGLEGMCVQEVRKLTIHPDLAYRETGYGDLYINRIFCSNYKLNILGYILSQVTFVISNLF